MFENCTTLQELNAARIQLCSEPGADITAVNNAYNERRISVLNNTKAVVKKIKFRPIVFERGVKYCALPIAGTSDQLGVLQLRQNGFYL